MQILIVDDEKSLLEQLEDTLKKLRYTVETASDGEMALCKIFDSTYDLIILDIMLPKKDGLDVLRATRKAKITTPILILSAMGEIDDKIRGLDEGSDDYLAKPFSLDELLARMRALLRRSNSTSDSVMLINNLSLNTATRTVTLDDSPIDLTTREFNILEFLLYNKNRVVSRFSLAEHVWGDAFDPFNMSNFMDVHMKNLRKKIAKNGDAPFIQTVRGVGYIIQDKAE